MSGRETAAGPERNGQLRPGVRGHAACAVCAENTARAMGSGELPVFATPALAACMERAAAASVAPLLPRGHTSVGVRLCLEHTAATPVGMEVRCESELTAVDGRRLTFSITAYDGAGEIGRAEHVRAIVDAQRFLEKTEGKRSP